MASNNINISLFNLFIVLLIFDHGIACIELKEKTNATMAIMTSTTPVSHIVKSFQLLFNNINLAITMNFTRQCPTTTTLLILTMSRRNGFVKRNAIRRTWMNDSIPGQSQWFLIADALAEGEKEAPEVQSQLETEQLEHGDLIFLHGFVDLYAHLHLKWYSALEWQQNFCVHAEFLLKTDDDTVVHLPRLNHWIEQKFRKELSKNVATYFGYVISGKKPYREKEHKWFVPESAYPYKWYPDYLQGATYLASVQAVSAVMLHVHEVNGFNMDDVLFTGILAKRANVTLFDAGAHFRVGHGIYDNEKCVDGVPEATAMYSAETVAEFKDIYHALNSINCTKDNNK